jgi:hypothetical protein
LFAAVATVLPEWVGAEQLVNYFDPLRAHGKALSTFEKDFKFEYQREFRFAWEPPVARGALPPVKIELGNLADVASLFLL